MADRIDPDKTLQVDHEAEDEVIQAAYRRLARKYHPDLAETPEAAERMSAINAAWELIGRPDAGRAYDERRVPEASGPPAAGVVPGSPPRPASPPPPDVVSRDWTSGRSTQGGGGGEST